MSASDTPSVIKHTCPSCSNDFYQPFVCVTCGAEKLYDETLRNAQRDLTALRERLAAAEKFAAKMFALSDWPEGGDIEGFDFQEAAVECGLLTPERRDKPCGEICSCEENGADWPTTCYRKAQFLIDAAIGREGGR